MYRSDWTEYDHPSTAVVEAVVAATGRDHTDLDALADYVDGDALDSLLVNAADRVEVSFAYDDVDVRVSATGAIRVRS